LHTDFNNTDISCFTQHWQDHQQIDAIKFDNFMSTSKFCRINDRVEVLHLCQEGNKDERTK
jgi:hypothetical protein